MPSPFPGMDPYLESSSYWGGFHTSLISALNRSLNATLPEGYFADIEEHVWLQADEPAECRLLGKPYAFLGDGNGSSDRGGVAVAEPTARTTLPAGKRKIQKYVKIVAPDHLTVVTVIEVLSPSNKNSGPEREKYLAKRDEYFATATNLVELDLLREGERMPFGKPTPAGADYYVFVCRGDQYPKADVWGFTVQMQALSFPVPLKPKDGSVAISLQHLIRDIYDSSRYATRVDYSVPPVPLLRLSDEEWAAELLSKRARRKK